MVRCKAFKAFDLKQKEKAEKTEIWETNFLKEIVENADLHKPVLNKNNDQTRIMRKIRLCSSFKKMFIGAYYMQGSPI